MRYEIAALVCAYMMRAFGDGSQNADEAGQNLGCFLTGVFLLAAVVLMVIGLTQ